MNDHLKGTIPTVWVDNPEPVTAKLDRLAELQAAPDAIRMAKQELIDRILTPEIRTALAEIEAEYAPKLEAATEAAANLEAEIRTEVLLRGETVKGNHLMAVWNKGRVSWDAKKLDGMMSIIPQLAAARKEGDPTISIRKV